jgi:hypothetical protein
MWIASIHPATPLRTLQSFLTPVTNPVTRSPTQRAGTGESHD